jgi:hypothetical protein
MQDEDSYKLSETYQPCKLLRVGADGAGDAIRLQKRHQSSFVAMLEERQKLNRPARLLFPLVQSRLPLSSAVQETFRVRSQNIFVLFSFIAL